MSAEMLQAAATRIRHDVEFGQAHGDDTFLLAVADWLKECGAVPGWNGHDLSWLFDDALTIARAYLGSEA